MPDSLRRLTSLSPEATSQLQLLKNAEKNLFKLGCALAPAVGLYTCALVVHGSSRKPSTKTKTFIAMLVEALSGGFAEGGAEVRVNALLASTDEASGDGSDSPVPGAIHHLVSESFLDRGVLTTEKGSLIQA